MPPHFRSPEEFREAMDAVFGLMSEDPEMGPRLREADVAQRYEFEDVGLVLNVRAGDPDEGEDNLEWVWADEVRWEPRVRMRMSSETANRYFQGAENVPIAIARRRIRTAGDTRAALALMPITKPVFARYRALVEEKWPHLAVESA